MLDTLVFTQVIHLTQRELPLLESRLKTINYNKLSFDSLNNFVINSFGLDIKCSDKSYQKIINLGLPSITKNKRLESFLERYYQFFSNRLSVFIQYDKEQTQFENHFWFYDQEDSELFLAKSDSFPFIKNKEIRKKSLVKLFESPKARNFMRSEYYRTEQLFHFLMAIKNDAVNLIKEIEIEVSEE